jgi:hypothetical protein
MLPVLKGNLCNVYVLVGGLSNPYPCSGSGIFSCFTSMVKTRGPDLSLSLGRELTVVCIPYIQNLNNRSEGQNLNSTLTEAELFLQ